MHSEYYARVTYVDKDAVVGFGDYDYGYGDYGDYDDEEGNHELEDQDEAEFGLT